MKLSPVGASVVWRPSRWAHQHDVPPVKEHTINRPRSHYYVRFDWRRLGESDPHHMEGCYNHRCVVRHSLGCWEGGSGLMVLAIEGYVSAV